MLQVRKKASGEACCTLTNVWLLLVTVSSLDCPSRMKITSTLTTPRINVIRIYLFACYRSGLLRHCRPGSVIIIALNALAALYVAIKFREVRKFLAGAFFVSAGILGYATYSITSGAHK